jgi:hypothetical protein
LYTSARMERLESAKAFRHQRRRLRLLHRMKRDAARFKPKPLRRKFRFADTVTVREYARTVGVKPIGVESWCSKPRDKGKVPEYALSLDWKFTEHKADMKDYGHEPRKRVSR